jgi:hypothetical protein
MECIQGLWWSRRHVILELINYLLFIYAYETIYKYRKGVYNPKRALDALKSL